MIWLWKPKVAVNLWLIVKFLTTWQVKKFKFGHSNKRVGNCKLELDNLSFYLSQCSPKLPINLNVGYYRVWCPVNDWCWDCWRHRCCDCWRHWCWDCWRHWCWDCWRYCHCSRAFNSANKKDLSTKKLLKQSTLATFPQRSSNVEKTVILTFLIKLKQSKI